MCCNYSVVSNVCYIPLKCKYSSQHTILENSHSVVLYFVNVEIPYINSESQVYYFFYFYILYIIFDYHHVYKYRYIEEKCDKIKRLLYGTLLLSNERNI